MEIPQGWQCPVCGKVMSPSMQECVNDHSQTQSLDFSLSALQKAELEQMLKETPKEPPKIMPYVAEPFPPLKWEYLPTTSGQTNLPWWHPNYPYKITVGGM